MPYKTSGDVNKIGIPIDHQVAVWTGNQTIQGTTGLTWDETTLKATAFQLTGTTSSVVITGITSGTTTLSSNNNTLVTEQAIKNYVDNNIGGAIGSTTSLSTVLSTEISTRTSDDISLTTRISTEESNRTSGITSLSTSLSTETSIRTSDDTSLTTRISNEESNRTSTDSSLSASIIANIFTGGTISDLNIHGNLFVSGTTVTVNVEELLVEDNFMYLNYGEINSGVTRGTAGIIIDRGAYTDYEFVFAEDTDTFRIGQSGDTQAVATREDSPLDGGYAIWDNATTRFITNTTTIPSLSTSISTETFTRTSEDTSLTTRISNEESTRTSNDTSLTTRISNEESTRSSVDSSLSSAITGSTSSSLQPWIDINRCGFVDNNETSISFNSGTSVFTLSGLTSSWSYYRAGIKYTISGSKTITLPTTTGTYYVTINNTTGTLESGTTAWTLEDAALPVVTIRYNSAYTPTYFMAEERHTIAIDRRIHKYLHQTRGTQYISGGQLDGPAVRNQTDAGNVFGVSATTIADEDLFLNLDALTKPNGTTLTYNLFYRTSPTTWGWKPTEVPLKYNGANYMEWDNNGVMTSGTSGNWYNTYLLFSDQNLTGRYSIVMGRGEFNSLAAAQNENPLYFDWTGIPIAESVLAYQFNWRTSNTYTSKGKCRLDVAPIKINISTTTTVGSGAGTDHNTLAGLQGGTTNEFYHITNTDYITVTGISSALSTEVSLRTSGDTSLSTSISTEISIRTSGDTSLSTSILPIARLATYTTSGTSAATTVLTASSSYLQYFTGTANQTVTLPVTSTLTLGFQFKIVNKSTGEITVNSSGGNYIIKVASLSTATITCVLTSGTGSASWNVQESTPSNIVSGEKVVTITSGGTQTNVDLVNPTISAAALEALAESAWSTGIATSTGIQGQVAYGTTYKYDCIGTNAWIRTLILETRVDLYLADFNDSVNEGTSVSLDAAYPTAIIGQRAWGTTKNVYEKKNTNLWKKMPISYTDMDFLPKYVTVSGVTSGYTINILGTFDIVSIVVESETTTAGNIYIGSVSGVTSMDIVDTTVLPIVIGTKKQLNYLVDPNYPTSSARNIYVGISSAASVKLHMVQQKMFI